ncbi:ADP-ribosylglycohydrolase family protein [Chitinophaga sancti]|uniref:ADP-ribosylglycohydrolase n=1 Tax=Chitinophaga sancti TaxID=1004 RepID=A0A1K1S246_9BACT|nr:ADP-ribosylglycohydrolase family protein [Chitinophaga sancti]WQD59687.1 ADP-ribosylglycohydrolase family protein [Chitinophaga sancti]WQG88182.1 ADP-ribosylglycohydrolase family protein [Chitinophaga sancti]SFW78250.1 ADP-ribosylglycohydrolase [Chitinophaga sancti]
MTTPIKSALLGLAVGDALGVPVEFQSRDTLAKHPVTSMRAYGSHNQAAGTWSDDSSLTFCLAETLAKGYELQDLANRFINWRDHAYWTPHGHVFDIGNTTNTAIYLLSQGTPPTQAGEDTEDSNGNGSLMRILPLLFYIKDLDIHARYQHVRDVSSLTHRHIRSIACCFIYLEIALHILKGEQPAAAYLNAITDVNKYFSEQALMDQQELEILAPILSGSLIDKTIDDIHGTGYVVRTLEAAIWLLIHTNSYAEAVLTAVNLGNDTDTTAAVTGGIAGLHYGWEEIPAEWLNILAGKERIENLITNLQVKFNM